MNQLTLHCQHWTPQSSQASSLPSFVLHHTPLTSFTSLSHVPAPAKTPFTPLHIAAIHTSLTNTLFNTCPSAKNAAVAIIPEDYLQRQPWICLAAQPLPWSYPLHPCPFQCTSHPLNRPLTISPDILALVSTIPFKSVKSPRRLHALLSPPPTPGGSPSLPPLCRMSLLPHLICPWTNSGPLSTALPPPSGLEMMSIGRKSRDLKPVLQYFNRGWTKKMMDLQSAPLGMRRTGNASQLHHPPRQWYGVVHLLHQAAQWWKSCRVPHWSQGRGGGKNHWVICLSRLFHWQTNGAAPLLALLLPLRWPGNVHPPQGCSQWPWWLGTPCWCPPLLTIWPRVCIHHTEDGVHGGWPQELQKIPHPLQRMPHCHPPSRQGQASCALLASRSHPVGLEKKKPNQVTLILPFLETRTSPSSRGVM